MKRTFALTTALAVLIGSCAAQDAARPDVITFGASIDQMETALGAHCTTMTTRETPPFMPIHEIQHQTDCDGFEYFGAPRAAEFVFGDDALIFVWILTEKSEEAAMEQAFTELYGTPTHDTEGFTAFADDNAAVRKDVPEALFYSPAIADQYRAFFDGQAAAAQ